MHVIETLYKVNLFRFTWQALAAEASTTARNFEHAFPKRPCSLITNRDSTSTDSRSIASPGHLDLAPNCPLLTGNNMESSSTNLKQEVAIIAIITPAEGKLERVRFSVFSTRNSRMRKVLMSV
jgi:hypothetical protein